MSAIPLLYAGNSRAFDGMVISLLSVVKYHHGPLEVHLFTMDMREVNAAFAPLTEAHRAYLEDLCREVNPMSVVILTDVGEHYRNTLLHGKNQDNQYTPYSFLRLYADRVEGLPDKLLYLDTDTVLCDDIAKLYGQDIGDAEFAAVRDRYGCVFLGINYLNSGVLLMNLPRIRETRLFQRALEACARRKIFLPDQTTINRMAKKRKILPRRFNEQKRERADTVVRHFSMTIRWLPFFRTQNIKPWHIDRVHSVLKTTAFDDLLTDYEARRPQFPVETISKGEPHHV